MTDQSPEDKMLKRQMYGQAGFALLRARVLPYIPLRVPYADIAGNGNARASVHTESLHYLILNRRVSLPRFIKAVGLRSFLRSGF
jgi:hypothetical protein